MQGGDLHVRKPRKAIPKESAKRKIEHVRYLDKLKQRWQDAVDNKTNFCFFCGEYSDKLLTVHHLKGRIEDLYLNDEYWVWAHNSCHVEQFHSMSVAQLEKLPWYQGFLGRLKEKSLELYNKQIGKKEKTHKLNPTLFDDLD